ncbi:MAG: DUF1501 domain-containing protein [Verrucomicrobiales bacterium]
MTEGDVAEANDGEKFSAKFFKVDTTQFNNNGNILGSPWAFHNYGQSGLPISDLFPNIGRHADDLCVIRSLTSKFSEHTNANHFAHRAACRAPGAWARAGRLRLGSARQNPPGFVVVNGISPARRAG